MAKKDGKLKEKLKKIFWTFLIIWVGLEIFAYFFPTQLIIISIVGLITFVLAITTFVYSIKHLNKFKEKTFAIITLGIASLYLLVFLIGFIIGVSSVIPTA